VAAAVGFREWLAVADHEIPDAALLGNTGGGSDARLVVYVLVWVARALVTDPKTLFDAPVGYPAPATLTASEHFIGSQVLFGPAYWLTGNAVLAANQAAVAAYPLAFLAVYAWARMLGTAVLPAATAGTIAALSGLQADVDLHVLQYPAWPLAAIGLVYEATRGKSKRRGLWFGLTLALAALTSYQIAASAFILSAILILDSAVYEGWTRARALVTATVVVLALLAVVSQPYASRLGEGSALGADPRAFAQWSALFRTWVATKIDPVIVGIAALTLAVLARDRRARRWRRPVLLAGAIAGGGRRSPQGGRSPLATMSLLCRGAWSRACRVATR
jgi:hypothetical protein